MKPSSWDKQLGLASPRGRAASQSDKSNNPSKNEVRNEVGLDVSHHTRISQRCGEKFFSLTSFFIGRDVTLREMHQRAVGVIHIEGAALTAFLPIRAEHEVINDELASAVEEIGKGFLTSG